MWINLSRVYTLPERHENIRQLLLEQTDGIKRVSVSTLLAFTTTMHRCFLRIFVGIIKHSTRFNKASGSGAGGPEENNGILISYFKRIVYTVALHIEIAQLEHVRIALLCA